MVPFLHSGAKGFQRRTPADRLSACFLIAAARPERFLLSLRQSAACCALRRRVVDASPWLRGRLTSSPLRLQFVNAATNMRAEPHFKWPHPGSFMEVTHGSRLAVEGAGLGRIQPFCSRTLHTLRTQMAAGGATYKQEVAVRAQYRPFWTPKAMLTTARGADRLSFCAERG